MAEVARAPRRILIIKPSSLGDIVHALPVLAAARRTFPDANISWLIARNLAPLLENHPLLNELIVFDRARWGRMWYSPAAFGEFVRFCQGLRRRQFDLVLDLQGLFRSGFLGWISGAARRVGFAAARELGWLYYTQRVSPSTEAVHAVQKNMALAGAAGLKTDAIEFPLGLTATELEAAARQLAGTGVEPNGFAAIVLGARWNSKRWADENFARLIPLVHRLGLKCVLLGGPEERNTAVRVAALAAEPTANLVGATSLRGLAAILARARLVVALDSGPLHLAAALNRPTVAIFGPTDPRRTGPFSPAARAVTHPVPCAPCLRRECPLGHHNCLRLLEPARVTEEAAALINVSAVSAF